MSFFSLFFLFNRYLYTAVVITLEDWLKVSDYCFLGFVNKVYQKNNVRRKSVDVTCTVLFDIHKVMKLLEQVCETLSLGIRVQRYRRMYNNRWYTR